MLLVSLKIALKRNGERLTVIRGHYLATSTPRPPTNLNQPEAEASATVSFYFTSPSQFLRFYSGFFVLHDDCYSIAWYFLFVNA